VERRQVLVAAEGAESGVTPQTLYPKVKIKNSEPLNPEPSTLNLNQAL